MKAIVIALFTLVLGWMTPAAAMAAGADLSRLVVIGDSLSAGFQNGSLLDRQQVNGYASLVAAQARTDLPLPLIAEPGIPNVLQLVAASPLPVVTPAPGVSSGRTNPAVQPFNLAVPGAAVRDALTGRPDLAFDDLGDVVLGLPGLFAGISKSQIEWAEALAPTTVLAWIGNMDALRAVIVGDTSALTPVKQFEEDYEQLLRRLRATGATAVVVANIPDVTVIPYLVPAEGLASTLGLPLDVITTLLGIGAGDFVTLDAFPAIQSILLGLAPGPLAGEWVLDAGEIGAIRQATAEFNAIIASRATAHGAAVVDVHSLFEGIRARGVVVGGQRLTAGYLGGLFSLDGIHPTNTGYAILANAFIRVLNTRFAAGIPPVAIVEVAKTDPLVLPGVGSPASIRKVLDKSSVAVTAEKE
jgi:phospholipase/lecithinase/hemolysin